MANREELAVIRGARAGDAACQLKLGKLYLAGGAGLPCSPPTALHWLARAAAAGIDEAWLLIGRHIAWQYASHHRASLLDWYARASDAGIVQATLTLAQLLLQEPVITQPGLCQRARRALEAAARAGSGEAGVLLARLRLAAPEPAQAAVAQPGRGSVEPTLHEAAVPLAEALPLARALLARAPADCAAWAGSAADAALLARCAEALAGTPGADGDEVQRMRELAATAGDRRAQLALGLSLARIDAEGVRLPHGCPASFKRAVRWLTLAGEQGLADAWFALSRIYVKPEFSQRCVGEAQACLERAAALGHGGAQLECGLQAWRMRRSCDSNDVKAAYWLQKAAAQHCDQAAEVLARIAPAPDGTGWAVSLLPLLTRELASNQPLLAARIELAALFGLTRAEALLLDVKAADEGHCLVVDIRASYGRGRRRLVLVENARQRQALDRIARQFEHVDGHLEGNYRQRLYRFKTWLQSVEAGVAGGRARLAA
ncbi:SEL1-like repeat protein [Pseudoduganella lutea]|uniref:Sel1 repeat family protein n=1 Tax=Pseudoduganella lutea TaxID=321985 RepID=A0A4V0Z3H9_9BURK|nr:SEL1-like repeat protein [Pseudoduganella lutea]QBE63503.1 sel1 repeat family protein [Pseudoduganella lutea]